MIELALLASGLVSAVTPYLLKGAEKLVDKAAEEGWAQRGAIWEKIKGLFTSDSDLETLHIYQKYPKSEDVQKDVAAVLEQKMKADPQAETDLRGLFEKLPQQVKSNIINITGDGNIALQDIQGSQIHIGGGRRPSASSEEVEEVNAKEPDGGDIRNND